MKEKAAANSRKKVHTAHLAFDSTREVKRNKKQHQQNEKEEKKNCIIHTI